MSYLTPQEKELKKKLNKDTLHRGYWPDHPFVFMRRWHYFKEGIETWWKKRKCKKLGHDPGVIWYIDGLPYPVDKDHMDKWRCSFVGGGISEFRGMCNRCWEHYTMFWPGVNPENSLEDYVHKYYPNAAFIYIRDFEGEKIRDQVKKELERMNKS